MQIVFHFLLTFAKQNLRRRGVCFFVLLVINIYLIAPLCAYTRYKYCLLLTICFPCMCITGSWRLWFPCCTEASAALDEVWGGRVFAWRAHPPAGLPVLAGWWGAARRPWRPGEGAWEGGEGANRSTHPGHHPSDRTQPHATEIHRWERIHVSFRHAWFSTFADGLKGVKFDFERGSSW